MLITKALVAATLALAAQAATIKVFAQTNLTFVPNSFNANVGDVLEFHFLPRNHSVVKGDFNNACNPASSGGFFSGFMGTTSGEAVSHNLLATSSHMLPYTSKSADMRGDTGC
jgi:plastocyanin